MRYLDLLSAILSSSENADVPLRIVTDENVIAEWERKRRQYLIQISGSLEWARIGIVLDDPYVIGVRDLVEFPDGNLRGYIRIIDRASLENGQSVAILLFDRAREKFVLLRHFRHATRSWHLEIPRGFGEPDTPSVVQAKKELWEELRVKADYIESLGTFHANTGLENTATELFFAEVRSKVFPNKNEGISEVVYLSRDQVEDYIKVGKITDGFTIAAYTRANLRGLPQA